MKKIFVFFISFFVVYVSHIIPLSYMVGSWGSFFSATTITAILMGKYYSLWTLVLFFLTFKKISLLQYMYFVLNRTPLLVAACSYKVSSIVISVVIPLLCMFLFIMHPIGFFAWAYAMYWIIPVVIFLSKKKYLFFKALSSVFIAHAIGSVLWIYTHDMSVANWISLIPLVAVERIFMACCILVTELGIQKIKNAFVFKAIIFHRELA